jgi:hypothetical protein
MPRNSRVPNTGYYNASDECWSLFTEVIGAEFSNAVLFGQVHQLTVDAYAVQHAGGPHPDKSVAVHLSGLYLALERGIPPTSIAPLLQQLATRIHDWPHFEPPTVTTTSPPSATGARACGRGGGSDTRRLHRSLTQME